VRLTRIRWTVSALDDLKTISTYIEEQRSFAAANRVCRIIYDAIQTLRRFPHSGKPGLEERTRELVVSALPSYIVAYRVLEPDVIQILCIWHGAQLRDE
jgi:toxin ParE1/3/4